MQIFRSILEALWSGHGAAWGLLRSPILRRECSVYVVWQPGAHRGGDIGEGVEENKHT